MENLHGLYLTNTKHHAIDLVSNNEIEAIVNNNRDLNFRIN